MATTSIRERLHEYIDNAEDRKVRAIYTMIEDELDEENSHWDDENFVAELDENYTAWENGKSKSYSFEDIDDAINILKAKRKPE